MDGLAIKEVSFNEVNRNKDARIDSAFFTTQIDRNITLHYEEIGECLVSTQYGISKDMNTEHKGYPVFRMNELHYGLCDLFTDKYVDISQADFDRIRLKDGDVLFNRTNSYELVGRTGIYYEHGIPQTFASYLVRFVPDTRKLLPEYLTAYLNTTTGVREIKRRSRQSINQTNVNPEEVKRIMIPVLGKQFQLLIQRLFVMADGVRIAASDKYSEAEAIISKKLTFRKLNQSSPVFSRRLLSESFQLSGRIDAEYYQPKYDYYQAWITSYKSGFSLIREEFEQVVDNCTRTKTEYPYVEIGDIDVNGGEASFNTISTEQLPANAKIMTRKGDILVSTVRPNRGAVAILDLDDLLVSGAFTVLRQKGNYKKEVLQALLRSMVYRDWLLRYNVGTSYPVIKDEDVLNMPIPIFDQDVQDSIAAKVQESFALRRKSKELLEYAKQAVEMAIEQGEDVALVWLKEKAALSE